MLTRAAVNAAVDEYGAAWQTHDPDRLASLFSEDAVYVERPYERKATYRGRKEIHEYWTKQVVGKQSDIRFFNARDDLVLDAERRRATVKWFASFDNAVAVRPAPGGMGQKQKQKVVTETKERVRFVQLAMLHFDDQGKIAYLEEYWHSADKQGCRRWPGDDATEAQRRATIRMEPAAFDGKGQKTATCERCGGVFPSRSKLFGHLRSSGGCGQDAASSGGSAADPSRKRAQQPRAETAEVFEARVRLLQPSMCVLDLTPKNVTLYLYGRLELAAAELRAVLAAADARKVLALCDSHGVRRAFDLRLNLVSLERVYLQLYRRSQDAEKALRRLATVLFTGKRPESDSTDLFGRISIELMRCKGVAEALNDARLFTKEICAISRHPNVVRPPRLAKLPHSSLIGKLLCKVAKSIGESPPTPEDLGPGGGPAASPEAALLADVGKLGLAEHEAAWVRLVLVARGATKALAVSAELRRYRDSLLRLLAPDGTRALSAVVRLAELDQLCASSRAEGDVALAVTCRRQAEVLRGCVDAAGETLKWVRSVIDAAPGERLFTAADADFSKNTTLSADFATRRRLQALNATIVSHQDVLSLDDWPPKDGDGKAAPVSGKQPCKICGEKLKDLWLKRSMCLVCVEAQSSEHKRCPFCKATTLCAHDGATPKCFACDDHSCSQCSLLRLDGAGVSALASELQDSGRDSASARGERKVLLAFDWDQTLCSTKSGNAPIVGVHTLDPELGALLQTAEAGLAAVVTKSGAVEKILAFLAAHGLRHVEVRSANREKRTKASVIRELLAQVADAKGGGDCSLLFVDDDLAEHTQPEMRELVRDTANAASVFFSNNA
jgi:hypothetical protein